MKKTFVIISLAALLISAIPLSVSAHSGSHRTTSANSAYKLCTVENCNVTGSHKHSGTTYAGHYMGDGHDYHAVCTVKNCTKTGSHEHDGTTCLPHNGNDGHSYHGTGHKNGGHK